MQYFYSDSTKGFYNHEINGDNIPFDAILITEEYYHSLLEGQSTGLQITIDASNLPILITPAPVPPPVIVTPIVTAPGVTGNILTSDGSTWISSAAANLTGDVTSVGNAATVGKINGTTLSELTTGLLKNTTSTGAPSIAVAGTDYIAPAGALGIPSSGTLSSCTVDGNSQIVAYTTVLADAGKAIYHPATDLSIRTYTIPSNTVVAYPIGTAITFINMSMAAVNITTTTDIMYLSGPGTSGIRSLTLYGSATAIKMTSTTWLISGTNLT